MLDRNGRCRIAGRSLGLLALFAVLALSACGGGRIEVERIAVLPDDAPKSSFVVVRGKSQDHAKEFPKFADQIAAKLIAKGLSRVDTPSQAKYAVMLSYSGDGMKAAADGGRRSERDKKGGEGKAERTVSIALFDLTRPDRPDEKVFGGWAKCTAETANSDAVIAALIDAILKDFPGKGRESYSASLPALD